MQIPVALVLMAVCVCGLVGQSTAVSAVGWIAMTPEIESSAMKLPFSDLVKYLDKYHTECHKVSDIHVPFTMNCRLNTLMVPSF